MIPGITASILPVVVYEYWYSATFDGNTGSVSDAQVLDTGEGVETGTFTASIGGACTITHSSGGLNTDGATAGVDNCCIKGNQLNVESSYWGMTVKFILDDVGYNKIGMSNSTTQSSWTPDFTSSVYSNGVDMSGVCLRGYHDGQTGGLRIVSAMQGFNNNNVDSEPWYTGQTKTSYVAGSHVFTKTGSGGTWKRMYSDAAAGDPWDETNGMNLSFAEWNATADIASLCVLKTSSYTIPDHLIEPYFFDKFAGNNGDLLSSEHTPTVDQDSVGWDNDNADIVPGGGGCHFGTAGECTFTYEDEGMFVANLDVGANTTEQGIVFRYSDSSNYWYLEIEVNATPDFKIIEVNGGSETVRTSSTESFLANTAYRIGINFHDGANGASFTGGYYWGGFLRTELTYIAANTFNQNSTKVGIKDKSTTSAEFTMVYCHRTTHSDMDTWDDFTGGA